MKKMKSLLALSLLAAIGCKATESNKDQSSLDMTGFPVNSRDHSIGAQSMVAVLYGARKGCTGVLISSDTVLTAGHCRSEELRLVVFELDTWELDSKIIKVKERIRHPGFPLEKKNTLDGDITSIRTNDLQLLKLEKPVPPEWGITPAKIAKHSPKVGERLHLYGMGIGDEVNPETNELITEELGRSDFRFRTSTAIVKGKPRLGTIISGEDNINPQTFLGTQKMLSVQSEKSIVAGKPDVQLNNCSGDSGGGVFNEQGELVSLHTGSPDRYTVNDNGERELTDDCKSGYGYHVDVTKYINWILDQSLQEESAEIQAETKNSSGSIDSGVVYKSFEIVNNTEMKISELYLVKWTRCQGPIPS